MDMEVKQMGDVKIEIVAGDLVATLDTAALKGSLVLSTEYVLDVIAAKIPGTLDDSLLAILKGALKA